LLKNVFDMIVDQINYFTKVCIISVNFMLFKHALERLVWKVNVNRLTKEWISVESREEWPIFG